MTIKQRIVTDLTAAMKAGDKERVSTLRMLKSRILDAEVALRADRGRDYELDDDEAARVLSTYAKQRRDSVESYEQAGRADRAADEKAELVIVQGYLPEQLDENKVRQIVADTIRETGATSSRHVGAVMKVVMPAIAGRADGKFVNRLVRELLVDLEARDEAG